MVPCRNFLHYKDELKTINRAFRHDLFYFLKSKLYFRLEYPLMLAFSEPTRSFASISTGIWFWSLVTHMVTPSFSLNILPLCTDGTILRHSIFPNLVFFFFYAYYFQHERVGFVIYPDSQFHLVSYF